MTLRHAFAHLRRPFRRLFRGRLRPRIVAIAGWPLLLGIAGCQSVAFGVANLGMADADAHAIHDPGHGLALDVYRPEARMEGPAPVVVFLYGGSWRRGNRASYRFAGRQLARQGMVAIVADYRTAPRAAFPGFVEDAASAVAWAKRHAAEHGGDPARVFLAGHSAGAQIAALIGTDARYLAAHGLMPRDLAGVIGLSGPYDFGIQGYEDVFGPPAHWPRTQPVNFADGDEPPFLLIHGTADSLVEPVDSRILAERLRAAGGRAELLWLPEAGHMGPLAALRAPDRQPAMFQAIRAFVGLPTPSPGPVSEPPATRSKD
jgi:acetyl esterase/lipase